MDMFSTMYAALTCSGRPGSPANLVRIVTKLFVSSSLESALISLLCSDMSVAMSLSSGQKNLS